MRRTVCSLRKEVPRVSFCATTGGQTNTIERACEGRPAGREGTDTQQSNEAAHGPLKSEKTVNAGHMEAHRRTS
eukprot:2573037-Prymnesium_polylepis.1